MTSIAINTHKATEVNVASKVAYDGSLPHSIEDPQEEDLGVKEGVIQALSVVVGLVVHQDLGPILLIEHGVYDDRHAGVQDVVELVQE